MNAYGNDEEQLQVNEMKKRELIEKLENDLIAGKKEKAWKMIEDDRTLDDETRFDLRLTVLLAEAKRRGKPPSGFGERQRAETLALVRRLKEKESGRVFADWKERLRRGIASDRTWAWAVAGLILLTVFLIGFQVGTRADLKRPPETVPIYCEAPDGSLIRLDDYLSEGELRVVRLVKDVKGEIPERILAAVLLERELGEPPSTEAHQPESTE